VQFGLQFQPVVEDGAESPRVVPAAPSAPTEPATVSTLRRDEAAEDKDGTEPPAPPAGEKRGEVLTLDAFRKK
jgi:hypothetical protein